MRALVFLLLLTLGGAIPCLAVRPLENPPLVVLCFERLLRFAPLTLVAEDDPRLAFFRDGLALLRKLENAGFAGGYAAWAEVKPYLDDPVLAVEADAVLENILATIPQSYLLRGVWVQIQQRARKTILRAWQEHGAQFAEPLPSGDLSDPEEIKRLADQLQQALRVPDPSVADRAQMASGLERLAGAQFGRGLGQAVLHLQGIYTNAQERGAHRFAAQVRCVLGRLIWRLHAQIGTPNSGQARGLLAYLAGGDPQSLLSDIQLRRTGSSALLLWYVQGMRASLPDDTSPLQVLAEARTMEAQFQVAHDGTSLDPVRADLLQYFLDLSPLTLPDSSPLERTRNPIDRQMLNLLAELNQDPRLNEDGSRALEAALRLVGDPRVDAGSLFDWFQSLFGERQSFKPDQFVRFLQEANAVEQIAGALWTDRQVVISREHRKRTGEELGPSFDLWVVDAATREAVETVEIKQTSRPRLGSDIGGIVRQATSKLDGEVLAPAGAALRFSFGHGQPRTLRHVSARRVLVIQIPWSESVYAYEKSGLTFLAHADGRVERWRGDPSEGGRLVATDDLFAQIGEHFPKIADSDYFDEIRLTDVHGNQIVGYLRDRLTPAWRIQRRL